MKSNVILLLCVFFLATSISVANKDTLTTQERVVLTADKQAFDSLKTAHDSMLYYKKQGYEDAPYLTWFTASLFLPGVTILGNELYPIDSVSSVPQYQEEYKQSYKKERREAAIYGTILGVAMLIWWGIIIL